MITARLLNATFDDDLLNFDATIGFQALDEGGEFPFGTGDNRIALTFADGSQATCSDSLSALMSVYRPATLRGIGIRRI